jgi:hypothetical protein
MHNFGWENPGFMFRASSSLLPVSGFSEIPETAGYGGGAFLKKARDAFATFALQMAAKVPG